MKPRDFTRLTQIDIIVVEEFGGKGESDAGQQQSDG